MSKPPRHPRPRVGDRHELVAGPWDTDGLSRSALEGGWELRIPGAIPGERVEVVLDHVSKGGHVAWASVERLLDSSPERVEPPCAEHARCGACGIQYLTEGEQLPLKVDGQLDLLPAPLRAALADVDGWLRLPRGFDYRHKSVLIPAWRNRGLLLGGYARRSHRVVDLPNCKVVSSALRRARLRIGGAIEHLSGDRLPLWPPGSTKERPTSPALRAVVLRANQAGEVLCTFIVTDAAIEPQLVPALSWLLAPKSPIVGVHIQVHALPGDAVTGRQPPQRLRGRRSIDEQIGPVQLRLTPLDFFQVNPQLLERITTRMADLAWSAEDTGPRRVVDLYCGSGVLGLAVAHACPGEPTLLGVERNELAVRRAEEAAHELDLEARFVATTPAVALAGVAPDPDVLILDPPRSGCRAADLQAALDLHPRIVLYLSCSAASLGRDAGQLLDAGYEVAAVVPADMMPHTPHVEWLVAFERATRP